MLKNNLSLRLMIEGRGVRYCDVAAAMGVRPETFSRMLNRNLTEETERKIFEAVRTAEGQKNGRN